MDRAGLPVARWIPPLEFDGYRLVRLLGRGGMGEVYLGQDLLLDRPVALKLIAAVEPDFVSRERFRVEARALARLHHPNVAAIYRIGEVANRPYLASEFVRGEGLHRQRVPMPGERVLAIAVGLARGLAAAHRSGVLHRDIKPANVLLATGNEVKLVDFGLAKLIGDAPTVEPAPPFASPPSDDLLDSLSPVGAQIGTPLYMAPEIFDGQTATFRSDIYSVGALLYYLCAGRPPHFAETKEQLSEQVRNHEPVPLDKLVPGLDPGLAAVIERCLAKDPALRPAGGDELREALEQIAAARARALSREMPVVFSDDNPYRGLRAFEAEQRAVFFGREAETRAVVERLRSEPWVLVAADSGIGKSSLCRAGVLPIVAEGALGEERAWSTVSMVPGRLPLTTLVAALAGELGVERAVLAEELTQELSGLGRALGRRLGERKGLLVFIDQLEELVTLGQRDEVRAFGEVLGQLVERAPGVRVLACVRGDFLTRLAALLELGVEVPRALYLLAPLSRPGIRDAVVGPARRAGVRFETEAMVDSLVEATASADGGLPLLQFALAELWRIRDRARRVVPMAALDAIGGVAGALSRHADGVLGALPAAGRAAARRIMLRLVTAEGLRARATEGELSAERPEVRAALDALVSARLLIARESERGDTAYEIAHEALIQSWGTLRAWLDDDGESRVVRDRVAAAAAEWERLGRGREGLWRARQLVETRAVHDDDLGPREADFLVASRRAARRGRRLRVLAAISLPLAVALAYGGVRLQAARELARRVAAHLDVAAREAEGAAGRRAALDEARGLAFARFDAHDLENGEQAWARARQTAAELERSYGLAGRELEAALMLDGSRTDVRGRFADILFGRALLAEEEGRDAQVDELLQRLELFDEDGSRRGRWSAPARLSLTTRPAGASVALERYVADASGRLRVDKAGELGATPIARELPPGSYRLVVSAGGASVLVPVLLGRGEPVSLSLDLPARVPDGYANVPAGRFLFGHSADESLRREFMRTVPLHPVTTPAYLIARHETTWADWLAFLDALPAEERARRTPHVATVGFHGAVALIAGPAGWELTLQPKERAYHARAGEKIEYEARDRRASQDWLRMPVSGVSWDDAQAYAAWLDRSGRLPGARLCSEHEWERAARGADGREYPHGARLEGDEANFDDTYGKRPLAFGPDEVGSHPASESPFGLADMAGNVWEWTSSSITPGERVARGGSYYFDRTDCRVTNREVPEPELRDITVGIRVCTSAR